MARATGKASSGRKQGERVRELFGGGVEAIRSGNLASGLRLLKQADRIAPGTPAILFNLGYVQHLAGRHAEAVGYYRRCLDRQPGLLEGWLNLATAAREAGQYEVAIGACNEVLARRPDDPAIRNDLGNLLVSVGRPQAALEHYLAALEGDPAPPGARRNLAAAHRLLGREGDAERELLRAITDTPDDLEARMALVGLLDGQNRVDEAEAVLRDKPGGLSGVDEHLLAGNLLMRQGRSQAAGEHYREVLSLEPDQPAALSNLGLVHALQSDRESAERLFRRATEVDPGFTDAWRQLVALRKYRSVDDPDIVAMRKLAARPDLPDTARVHLGFALAKALDDSGCHDEAFAFCRQANDLRRRETPFDAEALSDHARRIMKTFDGNFLKERSGWGSDSMLPVYIVGMPRTGTTLLEQILSVHPSFHGAGELLLINRLIARLETPGGAESAYPECVVSLGADAVDSLAADYLVELGRTDPEGSAIRIGDKMPYNFFHLGLVRLLFPRARIIHCLRDPLDACVSAYFNYFPRGLDFTYAFDDLLAFFRIYRQMMAHWKQVAGIDFLDVHYEDIVAEPESTVRGVLDQLGLEWDPKVLSFHESTREVGTLSAWQVRRPLHGASRGRWRNYEAWIGPLVEGTSEIDG